MLRQVFVSLFAWICLGTCWAQPDQLIPRNALFKNPSERAFGLTEKGDFVFWLSQKNRGNGLQFFEISTAQESSIPYEKRLLYARGFVGNSVLLFSLSDSEVELSAVNLESHNTTEVMQAADIRFSQHSTSGAILYRKASREAEAEYFHLDASMKVRSLGTYPEREKVLFDGDLLPLASSQTSPEGTVNLCYFKNDTWKIIESFDWNEGLYIGGLQRVLSVHEDGTKIYYTSNSERDKNALFEFDVLQDESTLIAESSNADVLPMGALLSREGIPVYAVSIFAKTQYHLIDENFDVDLNTIRHKIGPDVSMVDQSWKSGKLLFRKFSGGPNGYYVYDLRDKTATYITTEVPNMMDFEMAKRHAFSFTTSDGLELPFHLYLPHGNDQNADGIPDSPLPTVIYVHGGPWVGLFHFNSWLHLRNYQLLANRGYAVVVAEFRGTTGLGKAVIEKSYKEWGGAMARDKAELANWLAENEVAEKDKVAIFGWSYGGYAAMAGLAYYPETYTCGISMYGLPSLFPEEGKAGYQDPVWANNVGNPKSDKELLLAHSPLYHTEKITKPLLMTTGSMDRRISKKANDEMADKLYSYGKEITYFYFPDEGHDYRSPESWKAFWAYAEEFLQLHLGGKVEDGEIDKKSGHYVMQYRNGQKTNEP